MCFVYWVKRFGHKDVMTEGYVGITDHPLKRLADHNYSQNLLLRRSLNKYKDIEFHILFEGTREECLQKEKEYRPTPSIGWNLMEGGVDATHWRQYSEEQKDIIKKKISATLKAKGANPYSEKTHSEESIMKANYTKKLAARKWYYNKDTLESKPFAIHDVFDKEVWLPGRICKKKEKQ